MNMSAHISQVPGFQLLKSLRFRHYNFFFNLQEKIKFYYQKSNLIIRKPSYTVLIKQPISFFSNLIYQIQL